MRHVHLKEETPKLFSQIATMAAKDNLISNMTKYQIATKPGHRATEHVFVVLSRMAMYEVKGKGMIISVFDLSKYFDSESLQDCCGKIYSNKVKGKVYRLLYTLNKNVRIRVKTPVGETKSQDAGPTVTQGSSEGTIISAVNLDNGLREEFHDKVDDKEEEKEQEDEGKISKVMYEDVIIHPVLFQDDILNAADTVEDAQKANKK